MGAGGGEEEEKDAARIEHERRVQKELHRQSAEPGWKEIARMGGEGSLQVEVVKVEEGEVCIEGGSRRKNEKLSTKPNTSRRVG